jgi:surfactin synthase thioesterase subunit
MDDQTFRGAVRDLGGLPPGLEDDDELWDMAEPTIRADFCLLDNYREASAPIGVPISVLTGSADKLVSAGDLQGWRRHTEADFGIQVVTGTHLLTRTASSSLILETILRPSGGTRQETVSPPP